MKTYLQPVQDFFRRTGLLVPVEYLRFVGRTMRNYSQNQRFISANPNFALPPADLAFDAYGSPNWSFYQRSGQEVATRITALLRHHLPRRAGDEGLRVLEWGCGPARVIRHLPEALPAGSTIAGTDYNPRTIQWCKANIPGVTFVQNQLQPPLSFDDHSFDAIYTISVFTHLSETNCHAWFAELVRVCRPGGLIIFTTHSDAYRPMMLPHELRRYDEYGFFERGQYQEGKKMFLAFHSPRYVRQRMLGAAVELEHIPGATTAQQDMWVTRTLEP